MENVHSLLDRYLFLIPISIYAGFFLFKKGIIGIIKNQEISTSWPSPSL